MSYKIYKIVSLSHEKEVPSSSVFDIFISMNLDVGHICLNIIGKASIHELTDTLIDRDTMLYSKNKNIWKVLNMSMTTTLISLPNCRSQLLLSCLWQTFLSSCPWVQQSILYPIIVIPSRTYQTLFSKEHNFFLNKW